jgi:hypothetical protein
MTQRRCWILQTAGNGKPFVEPETFWQRDLVEFFPNSRAVATRCRHCGRRCQLGGDPATCGFAELPPLLQGSPLRFYVKILYSPRRQSLADNQCTETLSPHKGQPQNRPLGRDNSLLNNIHVRTLKLRVLLMNASKWFIFFKDSEDYDCHATERRASIILLL